MKHLFVLVFSLLLSTVGAQAVINEAYTAPVLQQVGQVNMNAYFFFSAPAAGGTVWESTISNDNPMGGLSVVAGNTSFYNGGMNGRELCENPSSNSYSLATPALTLKAGVTYQLSYRSCGSRSSANKTICVKMGHAGEAGTIIEDAYEANPSLMFEDHTATFTVSADGADYVVTFEVTAGSKAGGINFMGMNVTEPVPAGRGELTAYNIWRDGEMVGTFAPTDAEKGSIYYSYTHVSRLFHNRSYEYALQAVYEGGESPLSNAMTLTTPEITMTEHADYPAPSNFQFSGMFSDPHETGIDAMFWFTAPAEGGVVWQSEISSLNPLGGLVSLDDTGYGYNNAGTSGNRLEGNASTTPNNTLSIPALSLSKGLTYILSYQSGGSAFNDTDNSQLTVQLYRGETFVKNICEPYYLSGKTWKKRTHEFTIDETADDYSIRFALSKSTKSSGAWFMDFVLGTASDPERGELIGYQLFRHNMSGNALTINVPLDEVMDDRIYKCVWDYDLEFSTPYLYGIRAVYEGGYSVTCPADYANYILVGTPAAPVPDGISEVSTSAAQRATRYDLQGRVARSAASRGLFIENGRKVVK